MIYSKAAYHTGHVIKHIYPVYVTIQTSKLTIQLFSQCYFINIVLNNLKLFLILWNFIRELSFIVGTDDFDKCAPNKALLFFTSPPRHFKNLIPSNDWTRFSYFAPLWSVFLITRFNNDCWLYLEHFQWKLLLLCAKTKNSANYYQTAD